MKQHVQILAWCFIIYSGILLLLAGFLFFVIGGAGVMSGDHQAMLITGAVATFVSALFVILALPGLIVGFGLMKHQPWARIVGIVLAALHLLSFPIGTALGIYALWVLLNKETQELFVQAS